MQGVVQIVRKPHPRWHCLKSSCALSRRKNEALLPLPAMPREQSLPESLETAYGLLRSAYLGFAWHLLQSAGSWQQAEASLYFFT